MRRLLTIPLILLAGCDLDLESSGEGSDPWEIQDARLLRARQEIKLLQNEVDVHHALRGEWPADWATIRRSGLDPWGNEYDLEIDGDVARVTSAGPDGAFGTGDDVVP